MKTDRTPRTLRAGIAMWLSIAAAGVLLVILWARGSGRAAWDVVLVALVLSCLGVCIWAGITGERTSRIVKAETEKLQARRADSEGKSVHPSG